MTDMNKIQTFGLKNLPDMDLNQEVNTLENVAEISPLEQIKSLMLKLDTDEVDSLLMDTFGEQYRAIESKATELGYQEGFEQGKNTAKDQYETEHNEIIQKLETAKTNLNNLLEKLSVKELSLNIENEQEVIALVHRALTLLGIDYLNNSERVKNILDEITHEYVEELGVEIFFNEADFNMLTQLNISSHLQEGFEIKPCSEISLGSYKIKTASGTLEFWFNENFNKISSLLCSGSNEV
ncbi:hypothetical protein HR060_10985 [Catenovulum sp. SM1970]|uniref:FliH/SctL family protein n=1 Tax=Marinifaba aquimaris TaxID=2741323 RepID=UPI0015728368|nr:hypothetical protein [Marinifaba aquimaris]NTS77384.1 hypothetical protein [Marinifaba aquimaris]